MNKPLTPELETGINQLISFFDKSGINYDKFNLERVPVLSDNKKAYPNYDQYMYIPGQHNTKKWLDAVKKLYQMETSGQKRVQSIRQVTAAWNPMETYDFL